MLQSVLWKSSSTTAGGLEVMLSWGPPTSTAPVAVQELAGPVAPYRRTEERGIICMDLPCLSRMPQDQQIQWLRTHDCFFREANPTLKENS